MPISSRSGGERTASEAQSGLARRRLAPPPAPTPASTAIAASGAAPSTVQPAGSGAALPSKSPPGTATGAAESAAASAAPTRVRTTCSDLRARDSAIDRSLRGEPAAAPRAAGTGSVP